MRWTVSITALLMAGGTLALAGGGPPTTNPTERLRQAFPDVQFYHEGGRLARVWGTTFGFGLTAENAAEDFVQDYADLFGATAQELVAGNVFNRTYTQPLMVDGPSGAARFTLLYYTQYRDGLPVFRAGLRLLVRNEPGNPLVWAGSSVTDLGTFRVPADAAANLNEGAAHATAIATVPGLNNFGPSELVVWPDWQGKPRNPQVALVFVGDNSRPGAPDYEKYLFVTAAPTGRLLHHESLILNTDVSGSVHGMATTIPKSDACNPEVDTPMPYAKVAIGSTIRYADVNGNFTIPNGGSSPVTVTSYMGGQYFDVATQSGSLETLTMTVTPPGPANFMHNQANTSETIRAQVNGYIQANIARDYILLYNPTYPTIATQTGFDVNVNIASTCNAYYDGSSINFYQSGGGCPNTAYSSVVHHEYGHHLVQCGGSGQGAYGEGMADCLSMLIADDPVLGYGFEGNCNAGIRTADNTFQYPCSGEIHYCGQLLSGCVWSTRNELYDDPNTNPTYRDIIANLTIDSVPLHDGEDITPTIYTDFITLDGGTSGPHYAHITAGFAAHNMVPLPPPANDACANATVACPGQTYTGNTSSATVDGATTCGSANSTPDVWYTYTPASSGTATFSLCSGTSYDSVMSIHSACPGTSGNSLNCDDDGCGSYSAPSTITRSVTAGTTYKIRISGWSGSTGAFSLSITGPACQSADTNPPTPNPLTWATPPAPTGPTAITMTATTATDSTPPVQYEFDFVSGGPGGADSAWQTSTTYTNSGLTPDTQYTYRVHARDSASPPNVGGYSSNATATTWANVPAAPTLSNRTSTSFQLDVNPNGNPAVTVYAVRCTATTDGAWNGKYVNAAGQPVAAEVWQTDAAWGNITIVGLQPHTTYTFAVKARNQQGVETAFGPGAALTTLYPVLKGDLNCDGSVNFGDINPFTKRLSDPPGYLISYPDCPDTNGDINNNGSVGFEDINPFVALLTG